MKKTKANKNRPLGEEAAREKCLRLLGLRARSAWELRDRLKRAGFADDVIESTLSGLAEAKLVDDEQFARAWVAARQASRGAGRRKLRWELRRKGISNAIIQRVVDEDTDEEAELQRALAVAEARLQGTPADPRERARLQRLLLGRGFEHPTIETVIRHLSNEGEHC